MTMTTRGGTRLLLIILFSISLLAGAQNQPPDSDQQFSFQVISKQLVLDRLKAFSRKNSERETGLKKMFLDGGCAEHVSELPVPHLREPDLICVLPGKSEAAIIVGAHFDHVNAGDGVVDNWSGAALLPSLYQSLLSKPTVHTFIFVAFSGEEQGLVGSRAYVDGMTKEAISNARGMINLECLGLGPAKVWLSHSDRLLAGALFNLAAATKVSAGVVDVDQVGSSDSESFAQRKIPRITIHSITQKTWPILHSARDRLDAIDMDDYYDTYRLLAGYLRLLDAGFDAPQSESSKQSNAK